MIRREEQPPPGRTPEREMRARTRRGFLALGAAAAAGYAGWRWLHAGATEGGAPVALRRVLDWNERITGAALFRDTHLAPEFPRSAIGDIRANGDNGMDDDIEDADWRLNLIPYGATEPARQYTLAEIQSLPRAEHITEFKCIEGWSTVVHWAGARFSDFTDRFAAGSRRARYAGLATPSGGYSVGLDMPSALHPQTLLCYEMNGKPLEDEHGAPLRLVIPVKYGIKSIKRIGTIAYTGARPPDYWAERGYDYYAGL